MSDPPARRPLPPTVLSPERYESLIWAHLRTYEGLASRIYSDGKGIPTMAAGIALALRLDDGGYALRDRAAIGAEISGDAARPYRFTPEEWTRLADTVAALNDQSRPPEERAAAAQRLIPTLIAGRDSPADNRFGFTLTEERMKSLTLSRLPADREAVLGTVRAQALGRGWTPDQAAAYGAQLRLSTQEGALTSLRYNGVTAPRASGALIDGDIATLRWEILYGSNPPGNGTSRPGIANRRRAEADMATGSPSGWAPEDQSRWAAIESRPEAQAYRKAFPRAFAES